MAQQQRELSGILFRNDKGDNQNRPDYRGTCTVGGGIYSLSAWVKDGQSGKFLSISFTFENPVVGQPGQPQAPAQPVPEPDPLPF
jgi:hypothetical protein